MSQKESDMLQPVVTIGILGGGQLARMLALAASRLGYKTHIYDPSSGSPAFKVACQQTVGSFDNYVLLQTFANSIDVLTYETENIPVATLESIEDIVTIFPRKNALSISQDRLQEKKFFQSLNLKTAKFASVKSFDHFTKALSQIGVPSILKTCREGYDGKGQLKIEGSTPEDAIRQHLTDKECILESLVNLDTELSVIVARNTAGEVVSFDPGENLHKAGILKSTTVPSKVTKSVQMDSVIIAGQIVNALDYVGVMGVEFFVASGGGLLVNEIAPRVHNSGHWTQNGCSIDQFEQHIRAIIGSKLGNGERHSNVKMVNILGDEINNCQDITDAAIHIYGKDEVLPGRKMGHINYSSQKKNSL